MNDQSPGIRRVRRGKHFVYYLPDGSVLRDEAERERIRRLAIPPAYRDVWICPLANGHLQATGRDARGRKQYRYHANWRVARDTGKFGRMLEFGAALPKVRARVAKDLAEGKSRLGRDAVLAALVRLLDTTLMRVGNDEYARTNGSYGLTTLRNEHATVRGAVLKLRFRGKSGVEHNVAVEDPRVARIVRRCQHLPGQELFQYENDEGTTHCVSSCDVNAYLREAIGDDIFSAKDFRTWHASVLAFNLMRQTNEEGQSLTAQQVLTEVASHLGNTPAVCRKSYVHPKILRLADKGFEEEREVTSGRKTRSGRGGENGLTEIERNLLAFLADG